MPNKQQRKQRRRQILKKIGGVASNLGKNALNQVGSLVKKQAKDVVNQMIAQGSSALMSGGIPFPTSGMLASATPSGGYGSGIQVSAPAANGRVQRTSEPRIRTGANGNTLVSHREYVADINVEETGFDLQFQFGVNPGNGSLFPWLSQIASRYETYSFRSLRIIYEPQCGTSSTGTLMLAIDYDSSDAPPVSKSQMMSYKNAVRAPLWFAACHSSATPDLHRLKTNYILSGAAPPNTDIKTYDIGNLFVAIQSAGSNQTAGELYVEYVVDLMTPQINNDPLSATIAVSSSNSLVNPFVDVNSDPIFVLRGPLPILVRQQPGTPAVEEFYIGNSGYYAVSISYSVQVTGATDYPMSYVNDQGNQDLLESNLTRTEPPLFGQSIQTFVQIQNTEALGFYIGFTAVPATSVSGIVVTITQIAEGAVLNTSLEPVSPTANPRARLGRIRPSPLLPSPFERMSLIRASDRVPIRPSGLNFFQKKKDRGVEKSKVSGVLHSPDSGVPTESFHHFTDESLE